jgi:hypothetical protein
MDRRRALNVSPLSSKLCYDLGLWFEEARNDDCAVEFESCCSGPGVAVQMVGGRWPNEGHRTYRRFHRGRPWFLIWSSDGMVFLQGPPKLPFRYSTNALLILAFGTCVCRFIAVNCLLILCNCGKDTALVGNSTVSFPMARSWPPSPGWSFCHSRIEVTTSCVVLSSS